jgi:hypothetical protein
LKLIFICSSNEKFNINITVPTKNESCQVCEKDLGLDDFKDEVVKNKQHFVNLIEEIVESMTREKKEMTERYATLVARADKDNQGNVPLS